MVGTRKVVIEMKKIITKIINKIEEIKEDEREYQEILARMRARKAREQYHLQLLDERAERLREQAKEERRLYIQSLIDKQIKESQEA